MKIEHFSTKPFTNSMNLLHFLSLRILPVLWVFCLSPTFSQTSSNPNLALKSLPASPTAASLGKYGDVPVSYYSGAANLGIPLYTIKTKNHEMDIHLQYSTSGLKPGEEASWVGLGWVLNAGGVITRMRRGNDDLQPWLGFNPGYLQGPCLPACDGNNNYIFPGGQQANDDRDRFTWMLAGMDDGEPDIFYYNFGPHSGKFVLNKTTSPCNNNGGAALTAERNDLSIAYDNTGGPFGGKWVVTDGNGYKYTFAQTEVTQDHGFSSDLPYFHSFDVSDIHTPAQSAINQLARSQYPDDNTGGSGGPFDGPVVTSWYLTQIVSPSGEAITLSYNTSGTVSSQISTNEEQYACLNLSYDPMNCGGLYYWYSNIQYSSQDHSVTYLRKIAFNGGYVLFNSSDRTDLFYKGTYKPQKLQNMEVYNDQNALVKRFVLSYDYFTASFGTQSNATGLGLGVDSWQRLKLLSVTEYGNDGMTQKKPYQFSYNTPDNFPLKTSIDMDWWGYYNYKGQAFNRSLLPATTYNNTFYGGGDRSPTSNLGDLSTGTLSSVVYPTGGSTTFTYEPNTYTETVGGVPTLKTGGGLRVKTLTDNDGSNAAIVKNYLYTQEGFPTVSTATSSGLLLSTPFLAAVMPQANYFNFQVYNIVTFCETLGSYYYRTSSSFFPPGFSANGATVGYSKVTEVVGASSEGGATEYNYRNTPDVPSTWPGVPSKSASDNGLLTSLLYKDNLGVIKKRIDNTYSPSATPLESYSAKGVKVLSIDRGMNISNLIIRYYDNPSAWYALTAKTETDFINGSTQVAKTTTYTYENPLLPVVHREIKSEAVTQSDGSALVTKYKRISDYNTTGFTANSVYDAMNKLHMVSPVIEAQTYVQRGSTYKILSGSITDYKLVAGNPNSLGPVMAAISTFPTIVVPSTSYEFHVAKPQGCAAAPCAEFESSISGSTLSKNINYESTATYDTYDNQGNLLQYTKTNDVPTSFLWGYKQNYLAAQVANAPYNQAAYTSFEDDCSNSNWTVPAAGIVVGASNANSKTGNAYYLGTGTVGIASISLPAQFYKVSFWANYGGSTPSPQVSVKFGTLTGLISIQGTGWNYYEYVLSLASAGQVTLNPFFGTQQVAIDELRLYPVNAQMTTYTHLPLYGSSSKTDVNNDIVNYTYDPLGRLYLVQDQDKNILKRYTYQYK